MKAKKYPIDRFALKGQDIYRSGTIDLTLTIGSSGIFSLTSLYISSFSLELTRILCKTWWSVMSTQYIPLDNSFQTVKTKKLETHTIQSNLQCIYQVGYEIKFKNVMN